MSASFEWRPGPDLLGRNLAGYALRIKAAVLALGQYFATQMESYAKEHAGWTDRTGNARQGLTGRAVATATGVIIYLFHTVHYGIWLELAHSGQYAIILRTLEQFHPQIMARIAQLLGT